MRALLFLCLAGGAAYAQPFTLGLKAGVPLTDFVDTVQSPRFGFNSNTKRYIIGGTAELRLPFGLGIEFDALYRRLNYEGSGSLIDVFTNNRTTGNAWEFPLLLKYRLPSRIIRPYVDAGVAWDTLSGLKQTVTTTVLPSRVTTTSSSNPAELKNNTTTGFVIGFGVDVHAIFIHLSPEIRYTRWGSQHFSDVNGLLQSNQNQGEFLLGITF
jgi:opacity protein-like surface antigen